MLTQILDEQKAYYRARAGEYDATAYPHRRRDEQRIDRIVDGLELTGDVLELACGTGMWTRSLARRASSLTALDQSPEVVSIAQDKCPGSVRFLVEDMTTWAPSQSFEAIFFAFWLSHVAADDLAAFFGRVGSLLRSGGRAVFVDEDTSSRPQGHLDGEVEIRTMLDGSQHRIVKVYRGAAELSPALAALGWSSTFETDGAWVVGQARLA